MTSQKFLKTSWELLRIYWKIIEKFFENFQVREIDNYRNMISKSISGADSVDYTADAPAAVKKFIFGQLVVNR